MWDENLKCITKQGLFSLFPCLSFSLLFVIILLWSSLVKKMPLIFRLTARKRTNPWISLMLRLMYHILNLGYRICLHATNTFSLSYCFSNALFSFSPCLRFHLHNLNHPLLMRMFYQYPVLSNLNSLFLSFKKRVYQLTRSRSAFYSWPLIRKIRLEKVSTNNFPSHYQDAVGKQ